MATPTNGNPDYGCTSSNSNSKTDYSNTNSNNGYGKTDYGNINSNTDSHSDTSIKYQLSLLHSTAQLHFKSVMSRSPAARAPPRHIDISNLPLIGREVGRYPCNSWR